MANFVFVDTNILLFCSMGTRAQHEPVLLKTLFEALERTKAVLLLPDVVELEYRSLMRTRGELYRKASDNALEEALKRLSAETDKQRVSSVFAEINRARETAMQEAAKYFDALAESKHTTRIPSNGDMVARALTFSISGHAPSKGKTARERADLTPSEPGYTVEPDCLIVAALRAQLLDAPKGSQLLLCTDNIKDFAVLDPESGSHALHPDVVAEMPCETTFFRTLPELLESGLAGGALSQDAKELYADAVEEAVALTAQLTGVKTKESTVCPSCSAKVGVEIGVLPGSTAHPVCPVCGLGFFVHRSATGEVFVRRDGKATERRIPRALCPQCGKRILLNLKDTDSGQLERFCFSCLSRLTIDSATGTVTNVCDGEAIAATLVSVGDGRTVVECPLCERRLRTIGAAGPDEFAVCNSDSHPPQLLRVQVAIDNAPSEG